MSPSSPSLSPSRRLAASLAAVVVAAACPPAIAQSVANGQSLYDQYCRSCHGFPPAGGPETAPNNPAKIRNATTTNVPAMRFLRFLSDPQLADIAAYLGSLSGGPPPPPVPAFDYSDLWYDPIESGWGFNVTQHASNMIFAVMYAYESPNRPAWFALPGGTWGSTTLFTGSLYRVSGPPFNQAFDPNRAKGVVVGTLSISFIDASHATLNYSINGQQVTKSITRQPF